MFDVLIETVYRVQKYGYTEFKHHVRWGITSRLVAVIPLALIDACGDVVKHLFYVLYRIEKVVKQIGSPPPEQPGDHMLRVKYIICELEQVLCAVAYVPISVVMIPLKFVFQFIVFLFFPDRGTSFSKKALYPLDIN